jgi:Micrococcal nuclease (thermonuclease) homologs
MPISRTLRKSCSPNNQGGACAKRRTLWPTSASALDLPLRLSLALPLVFLVLFGSSAMGESYGDVAVDEVTSIYDADTFRVNISTWPDVIGKRISVRVKGIDAPEIKGACLQEKLAARRAKQETVIRLRSAKQIELRNIERDKYFRLLADVYLDGDSLAATLVARKLAKPYDGGRKINWCD